MKKDPLTKEEFEPKRSNQRFASASNRIAFHNRLAMEKRKIKSVVDYTIASNWNIMLKQLSGDRKVTRTKEFLKGAGFDFNYFQRIYKNNSVVLYRIYNCGFYIKDESVTILKVKE